MNKLTASRFPNFFKALWHKDSFAWQNGLAERVIQNEVSPWPEGIALPTASGKTACMDIAVFALATQADRLECGQVLTAPRRIFFVVDRRVIVDEAFQRAQDLAWKLRTAESGILKEVADRLRKLSGGQDPLACFQLRGGLFRSDDWARYPTQPIIVASTVDQIGSRLLFRAYGRNFKACPIQAGLTGNDSLILLDEAHCAQPFFETLQAVRKYRAWAERPLPSPFHVVVMSATPPECLLDVFEDKSDEPNDPRHPLGARQQASKPTRLVHLDSSGMELSRNIQNQRKELKKAENEKAARSKIIEHRKQLLVLESKASEQLAINLVDAALELVKEQPIAAVIFANRVDTAKQAHALLREKHKDDAILLTGRMRPIDKDDLIKDRLDRLSADLSHIRQLNAPVFVVATQTLEVGANLDFDVLVSECASLDALRQRFGRLNRMGRSIISHAAIIIRAGQDKNSADDPVYGAALSKTWAWLNKQAGKKHEVGMGISEISTLLKDPFEVTEINAPAYHAPVMLPAHVDCWVQTCPEPMPTPDVALFLHGRKSGPADVQICWRADLVGDDLDAWQDAVSMCPPNSPECVSVSLVQFRRWLTGKAHLGLLADVEGRAEQVNDIESHVLKNNRYVVRWRGRNDISPVSSPDDIFPGDVVIIPAGLRGWDILATLDSETPIIDIGDRAYALSKNKVLMRIHPEILKQLPQTEPIARLSRLGKNAAIAFEEDPAGLIQEARTILKEIFQDNNIPGWFSAMAANLAGDKLLNKHVMPHPTGGLILKGSRPLVNQSSGTDVFSEEDDDLSSGTVHVEMSDHLEGVAALAEQFAQYCGLPKELTAIFNAAGNNHDLGKADPRCQAWLRGGIPWAMGGLLAKSGTMARGYKASEQARKRAGYPDGGGHELLSIRLLESAPDILPENDEMRELILHLIESHHGYCRPFAPAITDAKPVSVHLEHQNKVLIANSNTWLETLDSGVADRFWRLTRRYGWWGLAWLEAILRLADHRRSEWEEDNSEENDNV